MPLLVQSAMAALAPLARRHSSAAPPEVPSPADARRWSQRKKRTHVEEVPDPAKKKEPKTFVIRRGKLSVRGAGKVDGVHGRSTRPQVDAA